MNKRVVAASHEKKSAAKTHREREPTETSGTGFFNRLTRLLPGSIRREESATADRKMESKHRSEATPKKSYGFSGSKLHYSDRASEDLYQYKNASSAMFRLKDKEPAPEENPKPKEKSESSEDDEILFQ